jgi:hypothetical protein
VRLFKAFGKLASFGFFPAHAGRSHQIVHHAVQQVQPFAVDVRDRTIERPLPCSEFWIKRRSNLRLLNDFTPGSTIL